MDTYLQLISDSYIQYWNYLKQSILLEIYWENYFYGIIFMSLFVWLLEIVFPWRKNQPIFRKGFWMDLFYLFFNFFLLNLIVLVALSKVTEQLFKDALSYVGLSISSLQYIDIGTFSYGVQLFIFFIVIDFIQWITHVLLHRYKFLWNFHKVHHSVKQMGFASHFRYHWMEPVLYNAIKYIPLAMIGGFTAEDVAIVHFFNIFIGHLNHANIRIDYGIFKYILNNPKMHIWHHAKYLPIERKKGVNFGITLSIWDYIFQTHYIPHNGRDIEIGFKGEEDFPQSFIQQELYPINK
jgi:sterol desaturase/sphingolipid hydroxylase (fatty acid hydroxylase superfamily)